MERFRQLVKQYESAILDIARSYVVHGVLPIEDLYQEGLIALDELNEADPCDDSNTWFRKLYVRVHNRMRHAVRYHLFDQRDWRKTLSINGLPSLEAYFDNGSSYSMSESTNPIAPIVTEDHQVEPSPEDILTAQERLREIERVVNDLFFEANRCERSVLDVLIRHDEVPVELRQSYTRVPGHVSTAVISQLVGFDREKVKRTIRKLREMAHRRLKERDLY